MTEVGDTEFGVQIGIGFLGKVATAVIGLAGSIIVARIVGPAGYGIFYISLAISQFLENPVTGWAKACKKRMTETDFSESEALGAVTVMIGLIIVIGGPLSFLTLTAVTRNPVIPVAVPFLFTSISSYWAINTILSGRENFSLSVWGGTVNTLIQISGRILLVVWGFGIWGMVGGTVIGPILVLPLLLWWIGVRPTRPSWQSLRSILEYARWSIPNGFLGTALSRMDTVLLGWLATAGVAGKYQVGLQITMPAVFISGVIGTGLMARVSNLDSREMSWTDDLWNSISYGSILAVPIFFGSLVISEELVVTVFGGEYRGAGMFVVGLALYRLLRTQTTPFKAAIDGLNRPDIKFRISLVSFLINVVLGIGLWFEIGASGIILATVLTAIVSYVLAISYIRKLTNFDVVFSTPFLKQTLAGILMAVFLFTMKMTYGVSTGFDVFGYVLVGGCVYLGILLFSSPHFRSTARGISKDFVTKISK